MLHKLLVYRPPSRRIYEHDCLRLRITTSNRLEIELMTRLLLAWPAIVKSIYVPWFTVLYCLVGDNIAITLTNCWD